MLAIGMQLIANFALTAVTAKSVNTNMRTAMLVRLALVKLCKEKFLIGFENSMFIRDEPYTHFLNSSNASK